jgi:guanine deaminase
MKDPASMPTELPSSEAGQVLRARVLRPRSESRVEYLSDARVRVDALGRVEEIRDWGDAGEAEYEDLRADGVLTPGYVDAHLHFPQTRSMGQATGALLDWLQTSIFPEESRFADLQYAEGVAQEFVAAQLAAGTTDSLVYGSVHSEACAVLFRVLDSAGLRAVVGPALMERDAPEALCRGVSQSLEGLEMLHQNWHGAGDGRLRLGVMPRFALSCDPPLLAAAGAFAREHALMVSTHIAETRREYELVCARFGSADYLEVYERFDLVHERSVLAHCIYLGASEWQRIGERRAVVAHCPDSNDFLGSGSMPVEAVLAGDRRAALGSDVAAGRGFAMAVHAAAAYDNALRRGQRASPERLFWWLTAAGSSALGNPEAGSLRPGQWADMALRPVRQEACEADSVLRSLLFDPACAGASRVWVGGKECGLPRA